MKLLHSLWYLYLSFSNQRVQLITAHGKLTFFCISCQENQDGHTWKVISFHTRKEKENKNQMLAKVFLNSHFPHITVFCQNKPSFKNETSSLHWRNNLHYANQFTFPTLQTNAPRNNKNSENPISSFPAPCTPSSQELQQKHQEQSRANAEHFGRPKWNQCYSSNHSMLTWINRRVRRVRASHHLLSQQKGRFR